MIAAALATVAVGVCLLVLLAAVDEWEDSNHWEDDGR